MGRNQLATLLREMQWGRVRECSVPSDEDGQRKGGLRWKLGAGDGCRRIEERRSIEVRASIFLLLFLGF